jgi:hypothetical protein
MRVIARWTIARGSVARDSTILSAASAEFFAFSIAPRRRDFEQ